MVRGQRSVAVVGAAQTPFGTRPESAPRLLRDCVREVLSSVDKGIAPADLGAGYLATLGFGGWQLGDAAALLAEEAGRPSMPTVRVENACASGGSAIRQAYHAIRSGEVDVALVVGVEKMTDLTSRRRRFWLGVSGDTEWERLAGLTFAGVYALMARRYAMDHGPLEPALAAVAVKNHANGARNPHAHFQKVITAEDHDSSPLVADPLRLYDCSPVSDGAAGVILARRELAARFTDTPVYLVASGGGSDHLALQDRESLTSLRATREAAQEAFRASPFSPKDVQFAEVHDCFTIAELLALEDLGLAPRGGAGQKELAGDTSLGGSLPVNPSGGLKAKGHPLGATGVSQVVEIFQQLRQAAGPRQVPGAERALAHNVGGSGATAVVHLFSR